jgi:tyrosine-protein kinase Etk/Wzc
MNPTIAEPMREFLLEKRSNDDLNLLDLVIVLMRRRKFIAYFTVSVTILTTVVVLLLPSKFTAETVLLPPQDNSSIASTMMGQLGGGASALASMAGAGLGLKNPSEIYVSLFRMPVVEDALIRRFGLMARYHKKKMSDARRSFESYAKVSLGTKDGLIRITVTDWDPNLAAQIANSYVDEYRKLSAHLAVTEASKRRLFFQQQLLEVNGDLVTAEEALKNTEQTTGVVQIDSQARALIESAATIRGQIGAKEVELRGISSYATEDNPQVVIIQQQLAALRSQLAQLGGKDLDTTSGIIVPKGKIPAAQVEYTRRLRDLRYQETVKEILAKQFEVAKLDEAREGSVIQVANAATPPDKRSSPLRTISVAVAAFLGFCGASAWCLLGEALQRVKRNPAERERLELLRATLK